MQDAGGKNQLPLCGQFFDSTLESKIAFHKTKGSSKQQEKGAQKRAYKKIMHPKAVRKVYNKRRK